MTLPVITLDDLLREIELRPQEDNEGFMTFDELRDTTGFSVYKMRSLIKQAHKDSRLLVKNSTRAYINNRVGPKTVYKFLPKTPSPKKKS